MNTKTLVKGDIVQWKAGHEIIVGMVDEVFDGEGSDSWVMCWVGKENHYLPLKEVSLVEKSIPSPFVVVVDTREQAGFEFRGLRADARQQNRPLQVLTKVGTLKQGDYSIEGFETSVAVERKSKADLFGTLGQQRKRFERELERLNDLQFACVVVEADWPEILLDPAEHSSLNPKTIIRSVIAWQQRFQRVHWWACAGRSMAESVTYRVLERFYRDDLQSKMEVRKPEES